VVARALLAQGATLAVAESCTGGLLAERITNISGSSGFFLGGVVCYSNELKTQFADVSRELLASHGAVSGQVARSMAEGIRNKVCSTFGVGITGIAGPGGATAGKPVGLVYIAVAGPGGSSVDEKQYLGEREVIRWQATQTALDLVRRALQAPASPSARNL
jgi:nicotinamide-nucleotide amidase